MKIGLFPSVRDKNQGHIDFSGLPYSARSTIVTFVFNQQSINPIIPVNFMEKVCGLDVHKDSVFACILDGQGKKVFEQRFGTLTGELTKLRDMMVEHGCGMAAMESTSVYWFPIWNTLQSDFSLKLANPYFIKQLPGRKSDVKDAQWIAECLQKDLIKGSFVPDEVLQQLRQ